MGNSRDWKVLYSIIKGLFVSSPLLISGGLLGHWVWDLAIKGKYWVNPTLGLALASLLWLGGGLFFLFALVFADLTEKEPNPVSIWQQLWVSISYFMIPTGLGALGAGLWVDFSVSLFKHLLDDPVRIGRLLVLTPLLIIVYEGTRFANRNPYIEDSKRPTLWRLLSTLQSLLILSGWLGGIYGITKGLESLMQQQADSLLLWLLLLWTSFTLVALWGLNKWEKWAYRKRIIPWYSAYQLPTFSQS